MVLSWTMCLFQRTLKEKNIKENIPPPPLPPLKPAMNKMNVVTYSFNLLHPFKNMTRHFENCLSIKWDSDIFKAQSDLRKTKERKKIAHTWIIKGHIFFNNFNDNLCKGRQNFSNFFVRLF